MTFTITFSHELWWIIPLIVTIISYGAVIFEIFWSRSHYPYGGSASVIAGAIEAIGTLFYLAVATVVSMGAWIVGLICR